MRGLESVNKSIVVFRKDADGNMYPVELSKEQAWYFGPTSNEFSHLSSEYIKSAAALIQLNKDIGQSFGAVPAYLALHGLELKLKAALFSLDPHTYVLDDLKFKYGHKINKLLNEYHKHFDSVLEQFDKGNKDKIIEIFNKYATKEYEYLDSGHGDKGSKLVVDFELIEEVVFKIIDTINFQLDQHFAFQKIATSILVERQKLHPNDPAIQNYWDKLSTHLGKNEKQTVAYMNQCNKDEILLLSEIFEDIALNLKSSKFIDTLKGYQTKFKDIDLQSSIDIADKYSRL